MSFLLSEKRMPIAYKAKKTKTVYLLPTLHQTTEVIQIDKKQRPDAIMYYNKTKGGVDTADQMLIECSTRAATRRWPVAVFQNLMDMCAMNAYVIGKESDMTFKSPRKFMIASAESLCSHRHSLTATIPAQIREETLSTQRKKFKICQKTKHAKSAHFS